MRKLQDIAALFAVVWTSLAIGGYLLLGDGWHGETMQHGSYEMHGGVALMFGAGLVASLVAVLASFLRARRS